MLRSSTKEVRAVDAVKPAAATTEGETPEVRKAEIALTPKRPASEGLECGPLALATRAREHQM